MAEDLEERLDLERDRGWSVLKQNEKGAILVRRKTGSIVDHLIIFILFGWYTIGIANALFFLYKFFVAKEQKTIRVEGLDDEPVKPESPR